MIQGRLVEAVGLFRESAQLCVSSPLNYAFLASVLGRLGRIDEAREALDRFAALVGVSVERWMVWQQRNGAALAGVRLAERNTTL